MPLLELRPSDCEAEISTSGTRTPHDSEKQEAFEPLWVEFDVLDPGNPFNFSHRKKWTIACVGSLLTTTVAWTATSFPVGNASMKAEFRCSDELLAMGLSAYPLGFAIAPLVLAPFSEETGRYPMYVASTLLFVVFLIPGAVAKNISTVIISRLLSGLAASSGSTLVGGTLADIFVTSERGHPMSLFVLASFVGTGLGPAVFGYVGERLGWRWIQWLQVIMGSVMWVGLTFLTQETRGDVILAKRAKALRKSTGDNRYQCRAQVERQSLSELLKVSMTRPLYLLFTEPIVAAFSLWIAIAWGVLYLALEAVSLVMREVYGFSVGEAGLTYFSVIVGAGLGSIGNLWQEYMYHKHVAAKGPEARLYGSLIGALVFPGGIFIFAFSLGRGYWLGPVIGLVLVFAGIFQIYLATFNFLADSYTVYASSAMSGQSMCRNLGGAVFPLFTFQLYNTLGFQWASVLSGCLGVALAPIPFILLKYGPRIRAASRFSKELQKKM